MRQMVLHIGMGKAASTFLQHWFAKQPGIFSLTEHSDVHEQICQIGLNLLATHGYEDRLKETLSNFEFSDPTRVPLLSDERLATWYGYTADPTPDFDLTKYRNVVRCILATMFPGAKVLLVTRGYAGALQGGYSQYARSGGYKRFQRRLLEHKNYFYVSLSVDPLVASYREAFGKDSVFLLPYELLVDRPQEFISKIAEFTGVDSVVTVENEIINRSIERSDMRFLRHVSDIINRTVTDSTSNLRCRQVLRLIVENCLTSDDPVVQGTLRWLRQHVPEDDLVFPDGYLEPLRGTATVLAANPLYHDYREQYLL